MSVIERPFYTVQCDYPGCGRMDDDGDCSAWSDMGTAVDVATDGDWLVVNFWHTRGEEQPPEPVRAYCPEHTVWDDDLDERVPAPQTIEWQLKFAVDRAVKEAGWKFDRLLSNLTYDSSFDARRTQQLIERDRWKVGKR